MFDVDDFRAEYQRLSTLSQTDMQAAANGAVSHYAQNTPGIIEELVRLQALEVLVSEGYKILSDVESELTYELEKINRREEVADWLAKVRENT